MASAIDSAARTINQQFSLEKTLHTVVEAARELLPEFDQVGISALARDGHAETLAAAGDLVAVLDQLQYDVSEGPCLEALRHAPTVEAPRISEDERWPRYVPGAVRRGLRAQLGIRLYVDKEGTASSINLYSTTSDEIGLDTLTKAELFATHAAVAVTHAGEREHFNDALRSRTVVGQALGILMERYSMDQDRAFGFLIRASSHGNKKLRDLADELVEYTNEGSGEGSGDDPMSRAMAGSGE